jgi:hypothetical protein
MILFQCLRRQLETPPTCPPMSGVCLCPDTFRWGMHVKKLANSLHDTSLIELTMTLNHWKSHRTFFSSVMPGSTIPPAYPLPPTCRKTCYSSLSKCANRVSTTCLFVSSISPARNTSSKIAYTCFLLAPSRSYLSADASVQTVLPLGPSGVDIPCRN